jgi:hypothetical protein
MTTKDLLINGTSIKTLAWVASWGDVFREAPLRGSNITYPGVAGDVWVPKVRSAYSFLVPLILLGTGEADYADKLIALRALVDSSTAPLTLVRKRTTGSGLVSQTCAGDYLAGLEPEFIGMDTGRVALELVCTSGVWT